MRPQFKRRQHRAREILAAVEAAYPRAWTAADHIRERSRDWPSWCYLPHSRAGPLARVHVPGHPVLSPAVLAVLAAWRMCQGVYRLESCEPPAGPLARSLPQWCLYVERDRSEAGAWLSRADDGSMVCVDASRWPSLEIEPAEGNKLARAALRSLQMMEDGGGMAADWSPRNPEPRRTDEGWRLEPLRPAVWHLRHTIGDAYDDRPVTSLRL